MNAKLEHEHHAHGTHAEPSIGVPGRHSSWERFRQWLINWPIKVPEHPHENEIVSFLPSKVLLQIERPKDATLANETLAEEIRNFLSNDDPNDDQVRRDWKSKLLPPNPEAIITFPPKENRSSVLSIVPLRLKDEKASNAELVTVLTGINASIKKAQDQKEPLIIQGRTTLNSVSPDWLVGSSGHGGPHPTSPGSWPVQASTPSPDEQRIRLITDKPGQTPEENTIALPFADGPGTGINIAILDTAPLEITRKEAYNRWKSDALVSDLLKPNGKLNVHTGIYADVELADYYGLGHGYRMSDHGLFIAGIIYRIAPQANLHLFKAFTSYGSASCESIAGGIKKILQMFRNPNDTQDQKKKWRPLIVNCSFSLNLNDDHPDKKLSAEIKAMKDLFEEIFKQLTDEKEVIVVAAAGNNIDNPARPATNYPAAFQNVLGVGALTKAASIPPSEFKAATYSHLSDNKNPDEGFMVFGGEPGKGNGVRSIYISDFPVYAEGCLSYLWRQLTGTGLDGWKGPGHLPPNSGELGLYRIRYEEHEEPYADWAGTSFAAPHLTGILANWCSQPDESRAPGQPARQGINIENVKWALGEMKQRQTDLPEQVILVV